MMRKCKKDLVFLYVLDEENQFCVPTYGHYPVIIDFGFSYIGDMENNPLWQTLNHTDVGFLSDRFDPIADPKLFLVTVSDEIKEARKSKNSKKLRNITMNNYGCLPMDKLSGWDTDTTKSAGDRVIGKIKRESRFSNLFKEYAPYCLDIIQTLIVLPLKKRDYTDINTSITAFLKEFIKIENEISTPFYCLYILKGLVDSARMVKQDYINKDTRNIAVDYFRSSILDRIDSVSKFCNLKTINYERLLCSLYCLSRHIEGILYEELDSRVKSKEVLYNNIPYKTPEELYGVIESNIEDSYVFNNNTEIIVMNCINNTCQEFVLTPEQTEEINSYTPITRGTEIYKFLSL
jgi:hypothetical protein